MENEQIEEKQDEQSTSQPMATGSYYDSYYQDVLNKFDTVITNENTISKNQEKIIEQNKTIIDSFDTLIYLVCIVFIYIYLRNMIKK